MHKQWYLNSQRNLPFWTWYRKMKKSWYMVSYGDIRDKHY